MNKDSYEEIINGEETYSDIVQILKNGHSCIIGWSDGGGTHFDVLFARGAVQHGTLQRGIQGLDLFVSVMSRGAFGFEIIPGAHTSAGYYNEKLGGGMGQTAEMLAELINEVRSRLSL